MEISNLEYNGKIISFLKLPENGLLLKTKDICEVLELDEFPSHEWFDLAEAISIAGKNNDIDFAEWLNEAFVGYELITLVRPQ